MTDRHLRSRILIILVFIKTLVDYIEDRVAYRLTAAMLGRYVAGYVKYFIYNLKYFDYISEILHNGLPIGFTVVILTANSPSAIDDVA